MKFVEDRLRYFEQAFDRHVHQIIHHSYYRRIGNHAFQPPELRSLELVCPDTMLEAITKHVLAVDLAAKHAWTIPAYSEAVRWAISLGHDTDATACIVGGIIGLRDGYTGIPKRRAANLRGQDLCKPLLGQLLHYRRQG